MSPRVAVVIPAFNAAATLEAAIASARRIGDGVEIVVVDDGSSDATGVIAKRLADTVVFQANAGAAVARRAGASSSESEYLVFLDADDELDAPGVRHSIALLDADGEAAVAAGRVMALWPDGREGLLDRTYATVDPESLVRRGFGPWPPAAAVFRRSSYATAMTVTPVRLDTPYAEDYEMLIRMAMVGSVVMHDEVTARYRIFDGKSSKLPVAALRSKEQIRAHYARHLGVLDVPLMNERQVRASAAFKASRAAAARGERFRAAVVGVRGVVQAPDLAMRAFTARARRFTQRRPADA